MAMEFAETALYGALMTPAWLLSGPAGFFVPRETAVKLYWYVALGAAVGGVARFGLGTFIQQRAGPAFPAGTLVINVTGSFVLGFIMRYALESGAMSTETRALLTTGFCGGYTTFSTFSYETALLLEDGEYGRAALYAGSSVLISLVATFLGFALAHWLLAWRQHV